MINRDLQLCLNEIQRWADANGLKFSMSKSVCFHFCNVHTPHPEPKCSRTLNGLYCADVSSINIHPSSFRTKPYNKRNPSNGFNLIKVLSVIFDKKLSFIPHIKFAFFKKFMDRTKDHINKLKYQNSFIKSCFNIDHEHSKTHKAALGTMIFQV